MRCETGFVLNLGSEKTRTDSQTLLSFLLTFQLFFASAAFLQHGFSAVKEGSAVASPSQQSLELLVPVPSILPCPTPSSFSTGFAQLRVPYSFCRRCPYSTYSPLGIITLFYPPSTAAQARQDIRNFTIVSVLHFRVPRQFDTCIRHLPTFFPIFLNDNRAIETPKSPVVNSGSSQSSLVFLDRQRNYYTFT